MSRMNLTLEELYTIMGGNIVPELTAPAEWPEWLSAASTAVSDYCAAQLGSRVILKKYDPDDTSTFYSWWLLQFKSFAAARDYEFSKKYALLEVTYDAGQGKGYNKVVDDDFTHGKKTEFSPSSTYTVSHTNDKSTHAERVYDSDTITPVSSDERSGSSATTGSGKDTTQDSGKDQRDLEETYNETLSPFEYLEGEKRVAAWSYIIELAEAIAASVCYAQWKEED